MKAPPLNVSLDHLRRDVWKVALLLLLLVPTGLVAAGSGPDEGTATGQLVVGGKPTPIAHAYARAQGDMSESTHDAFDSTESFCGSEADPLAHGNEWRVAQEMTDSWF